MRQIIYYHGHRYTRRPYRHVEYNRPVITIIVHRWERTATGRRAPVLTAERSFPGIPFRARPEDAGCYVDGHWGQYAVAHMVNRAEEFGYDDAEVIALADRHIADIGLSGTNPLTSDEQEILTDASDDVESWLNEHIAPEDYSFGWCDGEFFLGSTEWWEES